MTPDPKITHEEKRLTAAYRACRAQQLATNHQLFDPLHSIFYPECKQLLDLAQDLRIKSRNAKRALRAYQQKLLDRRN